MKTKLQNFKIKKYLFFLILFFSFFVLAGSARASDLYVATNGSDSSSGLIGAPFRTIQKAADIVNPGDTVHVRGGTYNERVTLTRSGTAGNYITFQPYPGETAILDGTGLGNDGRMIQGADLSYIKIIGLKIQNYRGVGIYLYGAGSHLEIRNNEISLSNQHINPSNTTPIVELGHAILVTSEKWNPTPIIYSMTDIIIDGNNIHDIISGPIYAHETLSVMYDIQRLQITNNTLTNITHIGINITGADRHWYDNHYINAYPMYGIVSGNTITNCGTQSWDSGLYVNGGKNITFENNTVFNGQGSGIIVSSEQEPDITENIIVRDNISYDNAIAQVYFGAAQGGGSTNNSRFVHNTFLSRSRGDRVAYLGEGTGNIVKNNIFYKTAGTYGTIAASTQSSLGTFDYDLWYDPSVSWFYWGANAYSGFSNWKTGSGQEANSITTNPSFADITANNYTLQGTSPAIDAGTFLTTVSSANGTGTSVVVADARYFHDGYGITGVSGDEIRIGSDTVTVTDINYSTNTITFTPSITWVQGEGVSYLFNGSRPDIGAYEYQGIGDATAPAAPSGLAIN